MGVCLRVLLRRYWELVMGAAVLIGSFAYRLALDLEYGLLFELP